MYLPWKWLYTIPHRNAPLSLLRVLLNTVHLPVQGQYTKPSQINSGTDSKTVHASKIIKGQCADNTPNTLILANRPILSNLF